MTTTKRQGDVLLIKAPTGKTIRGRVRQELEDGRVILAHGEVTGHAHALDGRKAVLYLDDAPRAQPDAMALIALAGGLAGDRVLHLRETTELRHEEHGPIPMKKGERFIVRRQRQYQWGRSQRVAD